MATTRAPSRPSDTKRVRKGSRDGTALPTGSRILALPHMVSLITTLAMTPEEAAIQAVRTKQKRWLKELKRRFRGVVEAAFVAAATEGDLDGVRLLFRRQIMDLDRDFASPETCRILRDAALPAARNGHLRVVKKLIRSMEVEGEIDDEGAWEVFNEAAANGHINIVKFAADYVVRGDCEWEEEKRKVMSSAIGGAHAKVVAHLLSSDDLAYDMGEVFEETITRGQDSLAKKIYGMYPDISGGENLIVQMASEDRIEAVKYLFNHGCKEVGLIEEAFDKAANCRCENVLEFLMSTGRVSVAALDRALECAASSGSIKAVVNLYMMRCASSRGIESAFEKAGSVAAVRFLHENEQVPTMSIIACFKHACGLESAVSMPKK